MLLDTNIVIYSTDPAYPQVTAFVAALPVTRVSAASYVEALGYPGIDAADERLLRDFFANAEVLPLSEPVLDHAIVLRQQRRMSLGDALIAATALVHDLTLVTRNTADFRWVPDLRLHDPLAPPPATP